MEESTMVLKESRSYLASLAKLAPQLNEATDRYMAEIKAIEAELQRLNLGVEVESDSLFKQSDIQEVYEDDTVTKKRYYFAWFLAFGRVANDWRFIVHHCRAEGDLENDPTWTKLESIVLHHASRDLRIAAAEAIPSLLEKIEKRVKEKIVALNKVADH